MQLDINLFRSQLKITYNDIQLNLFTLLRLNKFKLSHFTNTSISLTTLKSALKQCIVTIEVQKIVQQQSCRETESGYI